MIRGIDYGRLSLYGSNTMEKKFIYLTNILFLLCDQYVGKPEVVGEKVAHAIIGAVRMLYPDGAGCPKSVIGTIRNEWLDKFVAGTMRILLDKKNNYE